MSGLGSGFVNLFKSWGKGIGKAADNFLLKADARKAISDEVINKFKPMIERAQKYESKRAANIKDLDNKLTESKANWKQAQDDWQKQYDAALAAAKTKRQTDINDYDAKLQGYQGALDNANASRQSIIDQLYDQEATYTPTKTIYTDVKSGDRYIVDPVSGEYKNITQIFKNASRTQRQAISKYIKDFDERLLDTSSGTPKVINAFDEATQKLYRNNNNNIFDNYLGRVQSSRNGDIRTADNQIKQAQNDLSTWQNNKRPADWDDNTDLAPFKKDFNKNNAKPTYSFNGQTYSKEKDLDAAYKGALAHEQNRKDLADKVASRYASKRDAEIAQRIQDAKDMNKAKLALGGALGAGALYAGAKAMYGGDDTDNTDNIDNTNNIDNTDNTYTGEPDPNFKIKNTPEGKAALNGKSIDTGFDPDIAEAKAVLAGAAYDAGVEDGNSIKASDDHFIDDAELYGLLKAMKDPYKADAVANYIYSKHGNESDVQNLGWRGWLNKYYGDLLRSRMNIDPSGYKGMHVSGGL